MKKIKKTFEDITKKLLSFSKLKRMLFSFLLIFSSASSLFISGCFSQSAHIEDCATYIINDVLPLTSSRTACISVSPHDKTNCGFDNPSFRRVLYETTYAFYYVEPFQKIVMYNSLKDKQIRIEALDHLGDDLSILTTWSFGSFFDNDVRYLKGLCFKLMFEDQSDDYLEVSSNFMYLFKNQADYLLDEMGIDKNNRDENTYREHILRKVLTITHNGTPFNWMIANIIFDEGPLYETCSEWFGNVILAYNHIFEENPTDFELVYGFHNNVYRNSLEIKEIINKYGNTSLVQFVLNKSISSRVMINAGNKLKDALNTKNSFFFFVLLILSVFLFLFFLIYLFMQIKVFNIKQYLINIGFFVIPWLIFRLIRIIVKTPIIFSYLSLTIFFVMFCLYIIGFPLVIIIANRTLNTNENNFEKA